MVFSSSVAARTAAARLTWPAATRRSMPSIRLPGQGGVVPPRRARPGHQAAPTPPTTSTRALFSSVAAPFVFTTSAAATQEASASIAHSFVRILAGAISGVVSALLTPKGALAAAAVGVTLGFIHFSPRSRPVERAYAKQVADTLVKVATPPPFAPDDENVLLTRSPAAAALATALDQAPPGFFIVVTGPPGAGKTTLVRLALQELAKRRAAAVGGWEGEGEETTATAAKYQAATPTAAAAAAAPASSSPPLPGGAAYVSPAGGGHPRTNSLGRDLAAAIGFSFEEGVRTLDLVSRLFASSSAIQAAPTESLARAASALEEAAMELKSKGAGRPLLVVDGCDVLAFSDPDSLLDMVSYAKAWAEAGLVTVAFIVSDAPSTLNLLHAAPGFSRAAPPVVVAGPTVGEAVDFLTRRLKAKGGGALPADLAGLAAVIHDDWLLLQKAASLLVAGSTAADVSARLVAGEAEPRFAAAGLLDRTPHQAVGLALAHALAALPPDAALSPAFFHRCCPDRSAQDALLLPHAKAGRPGSPFRYEPGVGLRFRSAVDAAYVRSGMLDAVAYCGQDEVSGAAVAERPPGTTAAAVGEEAGVEEVE